MTPPEINGNGPGDRNGPAGTGPNPKKDLLTGKTGSDSTASGRQPASDLRLPIPPVLSPEGQALVVAGRGYYVATTKPQAPKVGAAVVSGRLLVDLTNWRRNEAEMDVAGRFWPIATAPDNAEVVVRMPARHRVSLTGALRACDALPAVRFVVEHQDAAYVQAAVAELRGAIEVRSAELLAVNG